MGKGKADASQPYHGILNVNKPQGWTSHDVVAWLRRLLRQKSIGHAGTLDPLATGVLLVCLGQATRVAEYLTASEKVYRAVVRLGSATDTYDAEGQVVATAPVRPLSRDDLAVALRPFIGEILQAPPVYSAIKQEGVAAYRRVRRGEEVELAPRPVTIHAIEIVDWASPDLALQITCGPGTYIRSLAHDLGRALGCWGHLASLVRLRSGGFSIEDAASMSQLEAAVEAGEFASRVRPIAAALGNLTPVPVDEVAARRLAQGLPIRCPAPAPGATAYARNEAGEVVAILRLRDGEWWPHKVFARG